MSSLHCCLPNTLPKIIATLLHLIHWQMFHLLNSLPSQAWRLKKVMAHKYTMSSKFPTAAVYACHSSYTRGQNPLYMISAAQLSTLEKKNQKKPICKTCLRGSWWPLNTLKYYPIITMIRTLITMKIIIKWCLDRHVVIRLPFSTDITSQTVLYIS